jgi:hypothetical protein
MKFCPVVPEICHGQVHGPQKERRRRIIIIKIKIIIRNGANTICLTNFVWEPSILISMLLAKQKLMKLDRNNIHI